MIDITRCLCWVNNQCDKRAAVSGNESSSGQTQSSHQDDNVGVSKTYSRIDLFTLFAGLALLARSVGQKVGHSAATSDLRLRYDLSEQEAALFRDMEYTSILIFLIFIGYFGNVIHKPVAIGVGALLYGVGCMLCATVYFVSGPLHDININKRYLIDVASTCMSNRPQPPFTDDGEIDHCNHIRWSSLTSSHSLSLLCVGQLFIGLGSALLLTLPVIYIEENRRQLKYGSSIAYGYLLISICFGYFIGTILCFIFLNVPENLRERAVLPGHLNSIGAWWMPYCLVAVLTALSSFKLFTYPRWIQKPRWLTKRIERAELRQKEFKARQKRLKQIALESKKKKTPKVTANGDKNITRKKKKNIPQSSNNDIINGDCIIVNAAFHCSDSNGLDTSEPKQDRSEVPVPANDIVPAIDIVPPKPISNKGGLYLGRQFRDLPKNMVYFMTQSTFCITVFGAICLAYVYTGYWSQLPYYLQTQFKDELHNSELTSADIWKYISGLILGGCITFSVASLMGISITAFVIRKFSLDIKQQVFLLLCCITISFLLMFILYSFGCTDSNTKSSIEYMRKCSSTCNCHSVSKQSVTLPVCSEDNRHQFASACVAGCESFTRNSLKGDLIYTNCTCTKENVSIQWCKPCYGHYVGYIMFHCIIILFQSASAIPIIHILLRFLSSVDILLYPISNGKSPAELRSFSLGFALWLIYLFAIIPGRVIFEHLQKITCDSESEKFAVLECNRGKSCWLQNGYQLRMAVISVTLCIQFLGILLFSSLYYRLNEDKTKKIELTTVDTSQA